MAETENIQNHRHDHQSDVKNNDQSLKRREERKMGSLGFPTIQNWLISHHDNWIEWMNDWKRIQITEIIEKSINISPDPSGLNSDPPKNQFRQPFIHLFFPFI